MGTGDTGDTGNGSYRVWTTNSNGDPIDPPTRDDPDRRPNPHDVKAVGIYFAPKGKPSDELVALQGELQKVLGVITRLYIEGKQPNEELFRKNYVRLFRLTQLGLEGPPPMPGLAKGGLASLTADLIDDEGMRVKTRNLVELAKFALFYSIPFIIVYLLLCNADESKLDPVFERFGIHRLTMANFILLWIGCFAGVCLSYAVRTASFTLNDLTNASPDRLSPAARLLLIGGFTTFFGLLLTTGWVDVKFGDKSVAEFSAKPTIALLLGMVFGLSEAALPGRAGKRVAAFIEGL